MGSRKYDLYGPEESKEEKIRYEVIKLPFQDQVRTVRGVVVGIWKNIKDAKNRFSASTRNSLKSAGVQNSSMALQSSAVVGAALVGVFLARKKSVSRQILYPTVAGGAVWSALYFSTVQNRAQIKSHVKDIKTKYFTSKSGQK